MSKPTNFLSRLFRLPADSRWDLAFRWLISISYPVFAFMAVFDITDNWYGWTRIALSTTAALVAFWLFQEVIPAHECEDCERTTTDTQLPAA